ncbi:histidine kinase [Stutzerimonas nosocomialis]|uniref:ATP-binding protein n=1 Tax=Stutzerimonas nosocomialis TaxID=1056496 RepID=UPI0011086491|nr:ATP-binding protein [Stutzerimonas nosocomialis]TLX56786.1 histidine kinase [Stutzerimonas nosocomialis]
MSETRLLTTVSIRSEVDVVSCRQCAKQIADWLGLSKLEQIRIATSISELARNVYQYARQGGFAFYLQSNARGQLTALVIESRDKGPGIPHLDRILDGSYESSTGMGVGLAGARRLMDDFEIETSPQGTLVRVAKRVHPPRPYPSEQQTQALRDALTREGTVDPYQEIQVQGEELLLTTAELLTKQQELEATNLELETTNKGVVALYSELEKTAQELQQAGESKSRFFSNMTHEFRTPINIIENISKLLLNGVDGQLNQEQLKQVRFISDAATELSELVNELLDLAEAQSGRMDINPQRFSLVDFMQQLRQFSGALSMRYPRITWGVQVPSQDVWLNTDRNRLFQIMRNLIGNAFKYTPQGSVTVRVYQPDADNLEFLVEDTGVGIAENDQQRVFEEFCRIRSQGLTHIEGTGLGLSLAQKIATLLKGQISLTSKLGEGSRFYVQLPCEYDKRETGGSEFSLVDTTILLIDDNEADRYLVIKTLAPYDPVIIEAETARASIDRLHSVRPDIILLDLDLPDISGEDMLESMDWSMHQRVIINTAKPLDADDRERLLTMCHAILDKSQVDYHEALLRSVQQLCWSQAHEG